VTLPGIRSHSQAQAELPWPQCSRRRNAKVESMYVVEIVPSSAVAAVSREACQKCTLEVSRLAAERENPGCCLIAARASGRLRRRHQLLLAANAHSSQHTDRAVDHLST
jgi:hypothetical protein